MKKLAIHFEKKRVGTLIHAERQNNAVIVTFKINKEGQKLLSNDFLNSINKRVGDNLNA